MTGNKKAKPVTAMISYCEGKTYANVILDNGSAVTDVAKCSGSDPFNPCVGAFIAMCKALGEDAPKAAKLALAVLKKSLDKTYIKVRPGCEKDGTPVGNVRSGKVVLRPDKHVAFATPGLRSLGVPGTPTKYRDRNNKPLNVGDLVTIEKLTGTVRAGRKWESVPGLHFVVCDDIPEKDPKGAYVMGLKDGCNGLTGKIDSRFRVRLAKTWKEVELGEIHDYVKVSWEADNNE